ncbi:MAG: ABC transporter permease subunit [Solirubrobacterales bacterium]
MKAELAKVRHLPLPRWTAALVAAATVIVGIVLYAIENTDPHEYVSVPNAAVGAVALFGAVVFGVWLATLEFASGTMQRTLTAEPNRSRVLAGKLVVVLVATAVAGVLAAAAASGLSNLAADHAGVTIDRGELAGQMFGAVPAWTAAAAVGFGFGLIARSFGGGIAAALVFVLAFDGLVSFIPGLEHLTFGALTNDMTNSIGGLGDTHYGLGVALLGTIVWCLIIVVPGWIRFQHSDLK